MRIDVPTLLFVASLASVLHAIVLGVQYLRGRDRSCTGFWATGSAVFALPILLAWGRGLAPPAAPSQIGLLVGATLHALPFAGLALTYVGVLRFLGLRERRSLLVGAGAIVAAACIYFTLVVDEGGARRAIVSLSVAGMSLATARVLALHRPPAVARSAAFLSGVLAFQAASAVARLVGCAIGTPIAGPLDQTPGQALAFLGLLVTGPLATFGLLLLENDRLHAEGLAARDALATERDQARASALVDALTTLANRGAFDAALEREFYRARRARTSLALVLVDVDQFKRFNDTRGHVAGDECLRLVASAVRGVARRPGDLAARYGGEELALILPDTSREGAAIVAERLRACIEELAIAHGASDVADHVTVSVGVVAKPPNDHDTPEELVAIADAALYRAKERGRNRVVMAELGPDSAPPASAARASTLRLVWRASYEVGHPVVDGDHRALFERANTLFSAAATGRPKAEIVAHVEVLIADATAHFAREQAIAASAGRPLDAAHLRAHAELAGKARSLAARHAQDELPVAELLAFLARDLLAGHILTDDRVFEAAPATAARA